MLGSSFPDVATVAGRLIHFRPGIPAGRLVHLDTGADDPTDAVRLVSDGFDDPAVSDVVRVTITVQ